MEIKAKFQIGDPVFHITKDSPEGVVLNWSYSRLDNRIKYLITFAYNDEAWCEEHELQLHKQF